MKKLPVGISTFSQIIEQDYLYIDKTHLALDLIENHKHVFLSRPRRFGKSLFVSMLQEIFEGNKKLFEGLAIYEQWSWEESYPVIKISFGGNRSADELKQSLQRTLDVNQKRLDIRCEVNYDYATCFVDLIQKSYEKYQKQVVILIDEYDKPILDNLDQLEVAKECREILKRLYTQIKESDKYIRFAFLTGVSKFSKASIFSGLNQLEDISLTPRFGTICGYTQNDIESSFLPYLKGVDLEELKLWYNGYNFLNDRVYNPFDILLFIKNDFLYRSYWFNTGTPSFLIKLLEQKAYRLSEFEKMEVGEEIIESFDIEHLNLRTVLFQAGYLTIKEMIQKRNRIRYILEYPNLETKMSLNNYLLNYFVEETHTKERVQSALIDILEEVNLEALEQTLKSLFASIAYNNFTKNEIANYEGFYASVIYAYFAAAGFDKIIAEDATATGRIDLSVFIDDKVFIFEFKVDEKGALSQIKEKKYHLKYKANYKDIYLVGVEFDSKARAVVGYEWERLS